MKELEKIKALPPDKRIEYIWDYYWYVIVGVLAVIVIGGFMIHSAVTYQEPAIEVVMVNTYRQAAEQEQAIQKVLEESGAKLEEGAVSVDASIRFGADNAGDISSANKLVCMVMGAEGDAFFWNGKEMDPYIAQGALADLREYLPEDVLDIAESKLIYATLDGERYPCGVDLKGNRWAEENGYKTGGFMGISRGIQNTELTAELFKYILSQY